VNIHVSDIVAPERAKYANIWSSVPDYRNHSPGLENVRAFFDIVQPVVSAHVRPRLIDLGCGSGLAGLEFQKRGFDVWFQDLVSDGLDDAVPRDRFIQACLWDEWWRPMLHPRFDYGFCCDVLEHLPTEFTMLAVRNIMACCRITWLSIALRPAQFDKAIGDTLHLTVRPYKWWLDRLAILGRVVEARDLLDSGLFIMEARR
jgi:hypothetical protein